MTLPTAFRDPALLVARLLLGSVFIAHGWQKLFTNGMAATTAGFEGMGVPLPAVSAWAAALIELAGGAALLLGAGTAVAGLLLVADMLGAYLLVHAGNGVFVDAGGFELVAALGAGALTLAAVGRGRFSVDALTTGRAGNATTVPAAGAAAGR